MTSNLTLIDSSFLYALYNAEDRYHAQAMTFTDSSTNTAIIPDVILPEVSYLFIRDVGHHGVISFLDEMVRTEMSLIHLVPSDIKRVHEIMATYESSHFDIVDTCIMALSERLQITQVCTFDRRDFSIFRPTHCDYLDLQP